MMRGGIAAAAMLAGLLWAAPAQAADKCTIARLLQLPVTIIDRSPTVPVVIEGHPMQLVVDSGSFFSWLSPETAQQLDLHLHLAPYGFAMTGIGGTTDVDVATVKDFSLSGVTLHKVDFLVGGNDFGFAGLLGQSVLQLGDVEYDFANGVVRLMRPHDCRHVNLAYWAKNTPVSILPIELKKDGRRHTVGTVELNGVKLRAIFDTGATTSMLTRHAARRVGFDPDAPGVEDAGFSRGIGPAVVQTWIAPFDSLAIGDNEIIKKIKLRVGDIDDESFDMLIGADFFLSHRVYVSNTQHKLFFTYNGGPVFDLSVHHDKSATAAAATPTTAQGFAGRGSASAARHDYASARKDLDRAVALAPNDVRYRIERARIELAMEDKAAGSADLDTAIRLAPDQPEALVARAALRIDDGDKAGAAADAAALDRILAPSSRYRFDLGHLYDQLGDSAKAIVQYGQWIDAHPHDSGLSSALNTRCWLRTLAGTDLKGALDDCNRALHLRPKTPDFLDSRGLVHLRSGDPKKAIRDYDDALKGNPKIAPSLYGRGLAKRRLGDAKGAEQDIAAAKAIDPKIAALFTDHGITD